MIAAAIRCNRLDKRMLVLDKFMLIPAIDQTNPEITNKIGIKPLKGEK